MLEQSQLDWTVRQGTMGSSAQGYVKEFTRHSSDILRNLDELRKRQILTDVCLLVDGRQLRAHKVVLMACSGYFYSVFLAQGSEALSVLPLPNGIELRGFQVLLDFMYTSRLALSMDSIRSVLAAAEYLRMDHVMDTCRRFIQHSFDHSSLFYTPSITAGFANIAPAQDREGAHQCLVEVPRVLPPSQRAHTTTPSTASTAADSCQRGSVLRCPDAWEWNPAGLDGIQVPGGAFQKVSGPSGSAGETSARVQAGPDQSNPAGRESVQHLKEEPSRADEECNVNDRAPNCAKPSILTPNSPTRSDGHPNSPTESSTVKCHSGLNNLDPKACNWKKYKFIVLNSLKQEEEEVQQGAGLATGKPPTSYPFRSEARDRAVSGDDYHAKPEGSEQVNLHLGCPARSSPLCFVCGQRFQGLSQLRHHMLYSHPGEEPTEYPPERTDYRTGEKPYRCCICSAQFNRPANLKTHSRIHSGEKPYKCETCGSCFVQVAHLRAHVLIHTGEKPYPCETCGTRFRHLQTLKSHIRIHTGEKPYHCKMCDLHFRHKSQLRLHLRQKHGAITNTKIRYKVLSGPSAAAAVGAF